MSQLKIIPRVESRAPQIDFYNSRIWIDYLDNHFPECEYYFKFALVWLSFNSYYEAKYKAIKFEKDKIKEFCVDNKNLYNNLMINDEIFKQVVADFKKTKYLDGSDNRECVASETRNEIYYFKEDACSFEDFLNVVYRIRNNFFHGSKDVSNPYNNNLIQWAYKYFSIFWKEFINQSN